MTIKCNLKLDVWECLKILMLHRDYSATQVFEAIELASAYNVYGYDGVLNILGQMMVASPKIIPLNKDKLPTIPDVRVSPPNLDKFQALMTGGGR